MAIHLPTPCIPLLSLLLLLFSILPIRISGAADAALTLHFTPNETLEWKFQSNRHFQPQFVEEAEPEFVEEADEEEELHRRSLYWGAWPRRRYYISYGALSANRVPCPPRSGRSYYTHNCYKARGPVHPYTRGCSAITRCRR